MASRPTIFLATTLLAGLFIMTLTQTQTVHAHPPSYINYTTIAGFFLQDDPTTNASIFDYASVQ